VPVGSPAVQVTSQFTSPLPACRVTASWLPVHWLPGCIMITCLLASLIHESSHYKWDMVDDKVLAWTTMIAKPAVFVLTIQQYTRLSEEPHHNCMDVVGMGLRALNRVAEYSFIDGRMDPAESTYEARSEPRSKEERSRKTRSKGRPRTTNTKSGRKARATQSLIKRHNRHEVWLKSHDRGKIDWY